MAFLPFRELAFAVPFLVYAFLIVAPEQAILVHERKFRARLVGRLLLYIGAFALVVATGMLQEVRFALTPALLAFVTMSAALVLLVPSDLWRSDPMSIRRLARLCVVVLIVQAVVGLGQAVVWLVSTGEWSNASGDVVEGTIHLVSSPSRSFANTIFATNVLALTVFCVLATKQLSSWVRLLGGVLGALALLIANVVHVLLLGMVAMGAVLALITPKLSLRNRALVFVGVSVLGLLLVPVLERPTQQVGTYADLFESGELPRNRVLAAVVDDFGERYPAFPFLGLGPGQFSSRAALIASGQYVDTDRVLGISPASSPAFDSWLSGPMLASSDYRYGSTGQPAFSWLTLVTEFGVLGVLFALWAVRALWRAVRGLLQQGRWNEAWVAGGLGVFVLLLGIQENYWETPQAILVPLILIRITIASVPAPDRRRPRSALV